MDSICASERPEAGVERVAAGVPYVDSPAPPPPPPPPPIDPAGGPPLPLPEEPVDVERGQIELEGVTVMLMVSLAETVTVGVALVHTEERPAVTLEETSMMFSEGAWMVSAELGWSGAAKFVEFTVMVSS